MILDYLVKALDKQTETDVSVVLYSRLLEENIVFKTEVKLSKAVVKGRGCRFDVLVYKDRKPLVIIEVKRLEGGTAVVQPNYYTKVTGLPTLVCAGKGGVEPTIRAVKEYLANEEH